MRCNPIESCSRTPFCSLSVTHHPRRVFFIYYVSAPGPHDHFPGNLHQSFSISFFRMSSVPYSEMGLSLATPFWKVSHIPPTPPTSPQRLPKILKRQASRFRMPRILKRTPTVESSRCLTEEVALYDYGSVSSAGRCPKHEEAVLTSSRITDEIQQPLAPVVSVLPMINVQEESPSRIKSKRLRKMPKSYRDLKATGPNDQICSELLTPSLKMPRLLPSPLPSEVDNNHNGYFAFRNPKEVGSTRSTRVETSYEFEGIVAGYCEDIFHERAPQFRSPAVVEHERQRRPATTPPKQQLGSFTPNSMRTPPTSNMSATLRSPKRERSNSLSSEATWLSKTYSNQDLSTCFGQLERIKTNETRLAEKSRRRCQLVQGPNDDWSTSCPWVRTAVSNSEACSYLGFANHELVLRYRHQAWESE